MVAPFAGAWIEILKRSNLCGLFSVAPFAGAWIEITADWEAIGANMSLPSRERGLKFLSDRICAVFFRRSLRGSVD